MSSDGMAFRPVGTLGRSPLGLLWSVVLAGIGTALALLLRWTLEAAVGDLPLFITFYPVVAVLAMFAGARSGIAATLFTAGVAVFFLVEPKYSIRVDKPADALAVAFFGVAGSLISLMAALMHRAQQRAAAATARQEAAEELARNAAEVQRQKELLAVTLASIGDAVIVTDTAGRVTFLNPEAQRLTAWTNDGAQGKPLPEVFRIINEHTRAPVENPAEKALRMGTVVGLANHTILIARDGRETAIDDSGAPVRALDGTIHGVVLVFRDITERKQAEEALRQSEARVRRKLDSVLSPEGDLGELDLADLIDAPALQKLMEDFYAVAQIPMSVIDIKGRVLVGVGWQDICTRFHRVHPETCKHCHESDTELSAGLGRGEFRLYKCKNNLRDIATPIIVGDRHVGNIFSGQFFFEGEAIDREFFRQQARRYGFDEQQYLAALDRVPRLTRETVDHGMAFFLKLADTLSQLGHSNVKLARLLVERDRLAASLRQSRELLEVTLASIGDGVVVTDAQGRVTFLNGEAQRLTGWSNSDAHSRPLPEVFHIINEHTRQPVENPAEKVMRLGTVVGLANHTILIARDGRETAIDDSGAPVRSRDGIVHGVVLVFRDITERKQVERDLAAANAAKDHFLAVLSHELRTPLAAVIPALDALTPQLAGDDAQVLELVRRNVEMEARLIDDLLDVTRIARNKIELDRRPVELRTIIRHAAEVCMPDIRAGNLEFAIKTLDDPPHHINADAARIQQVFWNLIKNAIKFTPAGGRVTVNVRRADGRAIIEVADTGRGIEPEHLPKLFTAFEQTDRAITRQFGGLGLGLAISKALVEMHGGAIRAQSDGRGKGATFTVELPLAGGVPDPAMPTASDTPSTRAPGLRILLVEDHPDTATIMARILRTRGHHVDHADTMACAIGLAAVGSFDVLLSDLGLPDGSGHDLMRQLRQNGHTLPGIALSGYGMPADIQQSRDAGFAEHLTKPVNLAQLNEALTRIART